MSEISTFYFAETDSLSRFFNGHHIPLDAQTHVTSIEMAVWVILLRVNGHLREANQLVNHHRFKQDPKGIRAWVIQMNVVPSAKWLLYLDWVYEAVGASVLAQPGNKLETRFRQVLPEHTQEKITRPNSSIIFLECSTSDLVMSCGFRFNSPKIDDGEIPHGRNVWGYIVRLLFDQWCLGKIQTEFTVPKLMTGEHWPGGYNFPKTVLILSDSMCRQVKSIMRGDVIKRGGGWYDDIAAKMDEEHINPADYKFVIVVCGANLSKVYNPKKWQVSWNKLYIKLLQLVGENSSTRIIINTPIWHRSLKYVQDHANWITELVEGLPNVKVVNWSSPRYNPFIDENRCIRKELYFGDNFHLSHKGFGVMWGQWCDMHKALNVVYYKMSAELYQS